MSRKFSRSPSVALACSLLAGACAEAAPDVVDGKQQALEAEERVWITTDKTMLDAITRVFGALETKTDALAEDEFAVRVPLSALPTLSEIGHEEAHRCGGFMLHESEEAALAMLRSDASDQAQLMQIAYTIDNAAAVEPMIAKVQEASIRKVITDMSAITTRFHTSMTGAQASMWLRDQWTALATGRSDVKVELIDHTGTPQPSVSMTITGSTLPNEIVVLGGHLDSTVGRSAGDSPAPGADDNASGIATITEVARQAFALNFIPDRTVVFYGYAAEEVGLVGSAEIAAAAKAAGKKVIAVLQNDMTIYNTANPPYFSFIVDNTNPALDTFGKELVDKYIKMPIKTSTCGYGCSDHASWTKNGFPSTFPNEATFAESNKKIHTVNDTLATSGGNANVAVPYAKFGIAFMAEIAKGKLGGAEPECSATKPCPTGEMCDATGMCVPATPAPMCSNTMPCPTGQICNAGQCVPDPGTGGTGGGTGGGSTGGMSTGGNGSSPTGSGSGGGGSTGVASNGGIGGGSTGSTGGDTGGATAPTTGGAPAPTTGGTGVPPGGTTGFPGGSSTGGGGDDGGCSVASSSSAATNGMWLLSVLGMLGFRARRKRPLTA
jgi:leucyl aminopeptidase